LGREGEETLIGIRKIRMERGRARWQIVDIHIPQQQLTTLKKEDQETPKGTHGVPLTVRNKALSESTNREAKVMGRMTQLNTPDPLSLKSPCGSSLH
jgi:hypothetical protein